MGFNKGVFEKYQMDPLTMILWVVGGLTVLFLPGLIALLVMYRKWSKTGKDPKGRGVIVPQYDVPKVWIR